MIKVFAQLDGSIEPDRFYLFGQVEIGRVNNKSHVLQKFEVYMHNLSSLVFFLSFVPGVVSITVKVDLIKIELDKFRRSLQGRNAAEI